MTNDTQIDSLFHAMADMRRRVLFDRIIRADGITVAELTKGSGVTQGAVSQHLKVLREADLIQGTPRGRSTLYHARPQGLAPLVDWLAMYETFWPARVAALRDLLKEIDE